MYWSTFRPVGTTLDRVGVRSGEVIHAAPAGVALIDLIAGGRQRLVEEGERLLETPAETFAIQDVVLRSPIPRPPAVRDCLGFLDHMRNCQESLGRPRNLTENWYEIPAFYFACPSSIVGPGDDVEMPPGCSWFDFELEIGAVIGAGGRDLTVERAADAIAGFTIYNDWSARDHQMLESPLGIGQGKGKDGALTLGPWLVTPDELGFDERGVLDVAVEARVNGEVIGSGRTGGMDWTFPELVSFVSRGVVLEPGDVIGSGTVPTCTLIERLRFADINAFSGWLLPGDVVELDVEGIGTTRQRVVAGAALTPLAPRPRIGEAAPRPRHNRAPSRFPYTKGLVEVADGVHAWLAPDGGYGWSNAGLVVGDGSSLLVDTLYDLHLTQEMLDAMAPLVAGAPIRQAVYTHTNGDHAYGGQLLAPEVEIIAAAATEHDMEHEFVPSMSKLTTLLDLGPVVTRYLRDRWGAFDFGGIQLRMPDRTFDRELELEVGGRLVRVMDLGPAHTSGDSVVHVPDAGVLFAGDLLFIGGTPIAWEGPLSNWIAACDTMLALDAPVIVPGHGPVTDADGVRAVRRYLELVAAAGDEAFAQGLTFQEAAMAIDLGEFADWLDAERVVTTMYTHYRSLDPTHRQVPVVELLGLQAAWDAGRR